MQTQKSPAATGHSQAGKKKLNENYCNDTTSGVQLDWGDGRIDLMLDRLPPAIDWLVRDRIPAGIVGGIVAPGGTGKSMALIQLAVALATGKPWLGMTVDRPRRVMVVSAEDGRDDFHRRLRAVAGSGCDLLRDNLYFFDRTGLDNRLTQKTGDGTIKQTAMVPTIAGVAGIIRAEVIVIDPLARFSGGNENSNDDGTRMVEALEAIRKQTSATVLVAHHTSKNAERTQTAARGASALVDGFRWLALMQPMSVDDGKKFGIAPDGQNRFVWIGVVKSNYSGNWPGMWLHRAENGVLSPADLKPASRKKTDPETAKTEYQGFLERMTKLLQEHGSMSQNRVETLYSGSGGTLGVGQKKCRALIEQALKTGDLVVARAGNSKLVALPGADPAESGKVRQKSGNRQPAESGKTDFAGGEASEHQCSSPASGKTDFAGEKPSVYKARHPAKTLPLRGEPAVAGLPTVDGSLEIQTTVEETKDPKPAVLRF